MFNPLRILRWLGRICIVFVPITIVLDRLAKRCIEAAFTFRGSTAPTSTKGWIIALFDAEHWLVGISERFPDCLGSIIAKLLFVLPILFMPLMAVLILSWFVKSLYDLPNVSQSSRFVLRSVFGKPGFPPFFIFREGGEEVDAVEEETLRNVGGPGSILLEQDAAVLLERAGRFTRVKIPPGVVKLQRFERVYATIDLSPRVWPFTVSAMSKEGIPIKCNVNVHFQVNPTGGEDAVFTAATCTWVRGEHWLEDKLDWAGRVIISNTEGTLRSIIARTPLNQLIPAQITHPIKGTRGAITKRTVRSDIERELRESLERSAPNLGAVILDVRLGDIEVEEIVRKHWAVLWRTGWRSWATEVVNEGKTSYREKIEDARIEGQVALLEVLGRTIQELKRAGIPITNDLVALHFLDVIENMDGLPEGWMQTYLPEPLMEAIEQLKTL